MDDNKERDEAILLIRAILAATKGSISEHELQSKKIMETLTEITVK